MTTLNQGFGSGHWIDRYITASRAGGYEHKPQSRLLHLVILSLSFIRLITYSRYVDDIITSQSGSQGEMWVSSHLRAKKHGQQADLNDSSTFGTLGNDKIT